MNECVYEGGGGCMSPFSWAFLVELSFLSDNIGKVIFCLHALNHLVDYFWPSPISSVRLSFIGPHVSPPPPLAVCFTYYASKCCCGIGYLSYNILALDLKQVFDLSDDTGKRDALHALKFESWHAMITCGFIWHILILFSLRSRFIFTILNGQFGRNLCRKWFAKKKKTFHLPAKALLDFANWIRIGPLIVYNGLDTLFFLS